MPVNVLLTGATGALGPHLAAELLGNPQVQRIHVLVRPGTLSAQDRFNAWAQKVRSILPSTRSHELSRLALLIGDLAEPRPLLDDPSWQALSRDTHIILHAAADTRFHAPPQEQWNVNVEGTDRLLQWAQHCSRLQRFVLVSTVCVAGATTGRIPEQSIRPSAFLNHYEQSKWEAEQRVLASQLPAQVARVSVVMGSHRTGVVHKPGALHQVLRWFGRGALPFVPASPHTTVDLISTETAVQCLARLAFSTAHLGPICHIAAGNAAVPLPHLMRSVWEHFAANRPTGSHAAPPQIIDPQTYRELQRSSLPDSTTTRVAQWIDSFLPGLLQPRTFVNTTAQAMWGGALPLHDWRDTLAKVIRFLCRRRTTVREPADITA